MISGKYMSLIVRVIVGLCIVITVLDIYYLGYNIKVVTPSCVLLFGHPITWHNNNDTRICKINSFPPFSCNMYSYNIILQLLWDSLKLIGMILLIFYRKKPPWLYQVIWIYNSYLHIAILPTSYISKVPLSMDIDYYLLGIFLIRKKFKIKKCRYNMMRRPIL